MKDVNVMTEEEYTRYGRRRMKAMIRMKELSEEWLKERDTPLQRLVLQTAEHHLSRCEQMFGMSRYDQRLSSRRRSDFCIWSKEAFKAGEQYFYADPVDSNKRDGRCSC